MKHPAFVAATWLALAVSSVSVVADELDDALARFIDGDGFARQDAMAVDERLLSAYTPPAGGMRPDEGTGPLEKALLLVETLEPALPRTRTMVRYGQMTNEEGTPFAFVTVERYNLGPATRAAVAEAYGEENTDTPEAFGIGPHVAWRIVTMPLMGQTAAIMETARREIPEAEAATADCGDRGCLAPDGTLDDGRAWEEAGIEVAAATAYPPSGAGGLSRPAHAMAELAIAMGYAEDSDGRSYWTGVEQPEAARGTAPFLFGMVDDGLGQESAVDTVLGQTSLNDDSIAQLWMRRVEMPGAVFWMRDAVQR